MRGCPVVSLQSRVVSQQVVSLHNEVDSRRSQSFHCIKKLKTASKFAGVHLRWLVLVFLLGESIARASTPLCTREIKKNKNGDARLSLCKF